MRIRGDTMNNKTNELINKLTQDIIKLYDIKIPINNINEVVEKLGGTIEETTIPSDAGIKKWNDVFIIFVPLSLSIERKRFAIAQELGHLFLHMGYMINTKLWNKQKNMTFYKSKHPLEEYQANEFASALLMPKNEYKKIMNQCTTGNKVDTRKIAEYFGASVSMASNRGKHLGYLQTFFG